MENSIQFEALIAFELSHAPLKHTAKRHKTFFVGSNDLLWGVNSGGI